MVGGDSDRGVEAGGQIDAQFGEEIGGQEVRGEEIRGLAIGGQWIAGFGADLGSGRSQHRFGCLTTAASQRGGDRGQDQAQHQSEKEGQGSHRPKHANQYCPNTAPAVRDVGSDQPIVPGTSVGNAAVGSLAPAPAMTEPSRDPLDEAIAARRAQDPLVGAKFGAEEVSRRLLQAMATDKGVHVESLLAVCGALAGHACQASLRARSRAAGQLEPEGLHVVGTQNGSSFLVGEGLAQGLFQDRYSTWGLAAAAAQQAGCRVLPDPMELWRHGMDSLGQEAFGVPQVPRHHQPSADSLQSLPSLWPALLPLVRRFCPEPAEWPILFGLLAQKAITMGREVIDPCLALRIVMDTAIANAMVIVAESQETPAGT